MGKTAFGSISGVPWSLSAESAYDIILDSIEVKNSSEVKTLEDEAGVIKMHVQDGEFTEVTFEATVKGANHLGQNALCGSVITTLSNTDVPTPLFITENGATKSKREWGKCRCTARYYGSGFTTGTLPVIFGTTTTTTTTAST